MTQPEHSLARLRTRWSAIGAAVAITLGAGGIGLAQAAVDSGDKPVTVTVDSKRILDTRINLGLAGGFAKDTPREVQVTGAVDVATDTGTAEETVVPDGATAVLVNVTVVLPTDQGFLTLRAGGASGAPSTSTVNFQAGSVEPNAATVDLSADGKVQVWVFMPGAAATADVLIDVVGYTVDHNHDDRYYTEAEVDAAVAAAVAAKADSADVYTKAEVDAVTKQLFATISSGGTPIYDSAGLVSSTRTATGQYTVTFDQPVNRCAVAASDWIWSSTRDVSAAPDSGAANEVLVRVTNENDVNEDTAFSIILHCLPTPVVPAAVGAGADAVADSVND